MFDKSYAIQFEEVSETIAIWDLRKRLQNNASLDLYTQSVMYWEKINRIYVQEIALNKRNSGITSKLAIMSFSQKGCVDLPASTGRTYCAPESQEVVRVDFHDTDPIPYEQPLNVIPAATERNNLSVAEPMKLSVGSFHLTIPNGTDPQLLAQTLRIVKELEC